MSVSSMWKLCLFLAIVVSFQGGCSEHSDHRKPTWTLSMTDRLRQDLLLNYDKLVLPNQHYNSTTVKFGIALTHFDIIETKSVFIAHGYINLRWQDDKLKWNKSVYGNLSEVHLGDHEIWKPDIFLINGAPPQPINVGHSRAIAYSYGEVLWVPPGQFAALCDINLQYWPFDAHICRLKFISWTTSGNQIDLVLSEGNKTVDTEHLFKNNEWKLVNWTSVHSATFYNCCEESYLDLNIYITVARNYTSYNAIVITPAFVIVLLTLMSFCLPPQAGEKIILQGVTAIMISLFLLYFTQNLAAMGTNTPLIVQFYISSLLVICFSLISSVAVIRLSRTPHTFHLPWILKQALTGWQCKCLFLGTYISQTNLNTHRVTAEEMRDYYGYIDNCNQQTMNDVHHIVHTINMNPNVAIQQDWILLAAAINRMSFYFYSGLFLVMVVVYSL